MPFTFFMVKIPANPQKKAATPSLTASPLFASP
jgi:hypothetical protein